MAWLQLGRIRHWKKIIVDHENYYFKITKLNMSHEDVAIHRVLHAGGRRRSREVTGGHRRSREVTGGRERSQEVAGGQGRSQEVRGGRRRSREVAGGQGSRGRLQEVREVARGQGRSREFAILRIHR